MLYYPPPSRAPLFQFLANKVFLEAPTSSSHHNFILGHLLTPTQRSGGSKSAPLSAPFLGPAASVSSNQGFFRNPRPVALTETLF